MQVLSWRPLPPIVCVDGSGAGTAGWSFSRLLLLLRGIARGLQLLRHLLIHLVQLTVLILQAGKIFGVNSDFRRAAGRFPRSTWQRSNF